MSVVPRLSIGLPVYNGERYLADALDALLGQTYEDFELIISDNASTDGTEDICTRYAAADPRIRYIRQPHNIGLAGNHNTVFDHARGELFKWASDDDLYARELLRRCVDALDEHPQVVLAHCWTAMIDDDADSVARGVDYPLDSSAPRAPDRFRSMLFDNGGDDDYGVIRTDILRRVRLYDSYFNADRTVVAEIALHGPFHQVPEWLYFRREHPEQSSRERKEVRAWCASYDRRRANRLRHPVIRLLAEYVWGYVSAIRRAPLSGTDRRHCYRHLLRWLISRATRRMSRNLGEPAPQPACRYVRADTVVARTTRAPAEPGREPSGGM